MSSEGMIGDSWMMKEKSRRCKRRGRWPDDDSDGDGG